MMKKTGKKKRWMAVKLDLEIAYDKISWSFLRSVLIVVGLDTHMVNLIMFCVTSASLLVLWHGEKLEAFQPSISHLFFADDLFLFGEASEYRLV